MNENKALGLITPMEAYATTDGELFHDKLEALAHQYGLDITPDVKAHVAGEINRYSLSQSTEIQAILNWETSRKLAQLKAQNV
jgi:hypothetical protein